jgi:deglycase
MSGQLQGKRIAILVASEGVEQVEIVGEADPGDYDGLVLPGGVANPDQLRTDTDAVQFVRSFFEAGKPVGVICHGPWTLINAQGLVGSRRSGDLDAFNAKLVEEFAEGVHEGQRESAGAGA